MIAFRVEAREKKEPGKLAIMVVVSLMGILGVLSIVFIAINVNPLDAIWLMLSNPFSSWYQITETLVKMTPIIFTGLAVSIALRMKLWNIGAEGQMQMGAFGAVWAAQTFSYLPAAFLLITMTFSAILCGAFLAYLVGALKRYLNVNEILTSLFLNYVAASFIRYFIFGPWRNPLNPGFPVTVPFVEAARLPTIGQTRLHLWFFVAILISVSLWVLIEKSTLGYEVRAIGESRGAALYAGMPVNRNIILIFVISGAVAALAGMGEMAGIHHKLQPGNVSTNFGSLGVIVAWLAGANPLNVLGVAFCAGALLKGSEHLQITRGVPSDIVQIIIALLLASVLICKFFSNNKIVMIRKGDQTCA